MSVKLDHEAYIRDVADNLQLALIHAFADLRKNCVTCEHFADAEEKCKYYNARPPATVIVKGCERYEHNIPF